MTFIPSSRPADDGRSDWRPAEVRPPAQKAPAAPGRRALRSIVLNTAGQDVAKCTFCSRCEKYLKPGMDMTFGEIIQAALRDDPAAMTNRTLWACDELLEGYTLCRSGIDLVPVVLALRREAEMRGLGSSDDSSGADPTRRR